MSPLAPALITGGINAGLSIIDGLVRAGRTREARNMLANIDIPPAEKFMYEAAMMEDPEKFSAMVQGRTEMEQITEDPRLRQSQMGALQQLQDIQAGGGYTTAERGDIEQISQDMLTRQRGAEMAGLQRAQSRGLGGSGLNLMADLTRRQGGIGAASQAGFDIAKGGALRAMQAGQAAGQLGGQVRGQEFGQQAQVKSAQDAINRANIAAQNQGQQFNIANQMAQARANQEAMNQQRAAAAQAEKDRAQMEMQKQMAQAQTYA
jgi:hypothetical protein